MGERRRRAAGAVLAALVAVLLPAGVVAATSVDPPPPVDGRVGATGFGVVALEDEQAPPLSTEVTTVAPPATGSSSTTAHPGRVTPTTSPIKPAGPAAPKATLPAGAPMPKLPPPTGIPSIAPASSWFQSHDGVSLRVRMEPAAPVAGQVVRFLIEVSTTKPCCSFSMQFGDGSAYMPSGPVGCTSAAPSSMVVSHTYASAGAYKASLKAAPFPCQPVTAPGAEGFPVLLPSEGASLPACVGIGPGPAAEKGCSPFPDFGPDTLVSPVIDPFCQIRSDCTKASTPR